MEAIARHGDVILSRLAIEEDVNVVVMGAYSTLIL